MAQGNENEESKKNAKEETFLRRYREFEERRDGSLKRTPLDQAAAAAAAIATQFGAGEE